MTVIEMQRREPSPCPECGVGLLADQLITYTFPYGEATIRVEHMALVCQNLKCRNIVCDARAEIAQEHAITAHVQETSRDMKAILDRP